MHNKSVFIAHAPLVVLLILTLYSIVVVGHPTFHSIHQLITLLRFYHYLCNLFLQLVAKVGFIELYSHLFCTFIILLCCLLVNYFLYFPSAVLGACEGAQSPNASLNSSSLSPSQIELLVYLPLWLLLSIRYAPSAVIKITYFVFGWLSVAGAKVVANFIS